MTDFTAYDAAVAKAGAKGSGTSATTNAVFQAEKPLLHDLDARIAKLEQAVAPTPAPTPAPAPSSAMRLAYDTRQAAGWAQCQANGFNTLFAGYSIDLLNQVKASGGKVIVNLADEVADGSYMAAARLCAATGAVAAFGIWDEPLPDHFALLRSVTAALHADTATAGIPTYITYYNAKDNDPNGPPNGIAAAKGCADLYGLDIYPSKFGWRYSLITELAAAADAAGLKYLVILGAFTDWARNPDGSAVYPLPNPSEYTAMVAAAKATRQVGQGTYSFGDLGQPVSARLENQAGLLAAVKAGNA